MENTGVNKMNMKLELSKKLCAKYERKLRDARNAIVMSPTAPQLSVDGEHVIITKDCYNKIVKAIYP